jgi:hypothetical protein
MQTFISVLMKLEQALFPYAMLPKSLELITSKNYNELRQLVIKKLGLNVKDYPTINGPFFEELEIGDITGVIPTTTFRCFPRDTTDPEMDLSIEKREFWCKELLKAMDEAARPTKD